MKLSTKVIEFTREDLVNLLSLITSDIHNYGLELDYDNRSEKYRTSYEYHKGVVLTRKPEEQICYEDVLAEDADDGMNVLQCALFGDIIYG